MSAFKFAVCHRNKVLRRGTQENIMIILASSFDPRLFSSGPVRPSPSTHCRARYAAIRAPLIASRSLYFVSGQRTDRRPLQTDRQADRRANVHVAISEKVKQGLIGIGSKRSVTGLYDIDVRMQMQTKRGA